MSWIKDIIDTSRSLAKDKQALAQIKSGLRNQAKLNHQFLKELLKKNSNPKQERLIKIARSLEYDKMQDALNYGIPYALISRKRVTEELLEQFHVKAAVLVDKSLEEMLESVYIKTAYISKDYDNEDIDLKARLRNLAKYNLVLIRLLT
ncbi:MAG: hypothetical protein KQI35_05945 [Bacteroidetes bacterium]|nr:hypothetical protein [Bacteroidota bacterium]